MTACLDGAAIEGQSLDDLVTKGYSGLGAPADANCAVGPTHVINATNVVIQWRPKVDPQDTPEFEQPLAYFFGLVGSPTEYAYTADPKVIYDQYAGRFVLAMLAGETIAESTWLFAVSKTSDPNDGWWTYSFPGNATVNGITYYIDYPGLAVDDDAVYLTANMYNVTFTQYYGPFLWILRKTPGAYDGAAMQSNAYDLKGLYLSIGTTQPAHTFGAVPPGLMGSAFGTFLVSYSRLTSGGREFVNVVSVNDPLGTAGGPFFVREVVSSGDFDDTSRSIGDAPQPGGPKLIDATGRSVFNAVWRDNSLYFGANCRPPSGPDAGQVTAHWWRLTTTFDGTNSPRVALADQGNIGGEDLGAGTYTFFPSVMVDAVGDLAVGFTASGPSVYAGAYFAARKAEDTPGTIGPPCVLAAGLDYYYRAFPPDTRNRWGDYTGLALCPVNETTFWVYNQYAGMGGRLDQPPSVGQGLWRTKLGKFHVAQSVSVAIMPGACPASLNLTIPRGKGANGGLIPVAVLGSETVDVEDIDLSSLALEGVAPLRHGLEDVATPAAGVGDCACSDGEPDGVTDLTLKFSRLELLAALGGGPGDEMSVVLTGQLKDGTPIVGSGCLWLVPDSDERSSPERVASLSHAVTNTVNSTVTVRYDLPERGFVRCRVYDVSGRLVATLVDGERPRGRHDVTWEASGVPSGMYFYRLEAGDLVETGRVVLLK